MGAFMLHCEQKCDQDTMRDHHNLPGGKGEVDPRIRHPKYRAIQHQMAQSMRVRTGIQRALYRAFRVLRKLF